jgi:hypothetical protein
LDLGNKLFVYSVATAHLQNAYVDAIEVQGFSTGGGDISLATLLVEDDAVIGSIHVHDHGRARIQDNTTVTGTFQVDGANGKAYIEAPATIATFNVDGTADFTADATVTSFQTSQGFVDVLAGADLTVTQAPASDDLQNLDVVGEAALVLFKATGSHVKNLTITDGGLVQIEARPGDPESNPAKVLVIDSSLVLQASGSTPTGTLDLVDNALIVDYGSNPYSTVKAAILHAYNGGGWDETGITTSKGGTIASGAYAGKEVALGYADNADLGKSSFQEQSIDSSAVLVKWTFRGDADLDGDVDVGDIGQLATYWQTAGDWWKGDFDYDGTVGVNDLGLLATNWQAGVGGPLFAGGGDPEDEFLDGIKELGLSEKEIEDLLAHLGEGGGDPL